MRGAWRPAHVIAILTVVCTAAVLTPIASNATAPTAVSLTDPSATSQKARVNGSGQLWTADVDPYTKTYGRVDANGSRRVGDGAGALTVDGSVRELPASTAWSALASPATSAVQIVHREASSRRIGITSVGVTSGAAAVRVIVGRFVRKQSANACEDVLDTYSEADWDSNLVDLVVKVPANDTRQLTFPSPVYLEPNTVGNGMQCIVIVASASDSQVTLTGI
jgi:hypothetical protein